MKKTKTIALLLPASLGAVLATAATATPGIATNDSASPADTIIYEETDEDSLILGYDDSKMLDEVVVSTRKPLVTSDGATLTYNVEEDPEVNSNSLLEMLRKVPSVSVDAEENVKINGQSNFKILVNGKDDPMVTGGDLKTVLKSMPANSVKKIEVINEPGAKYDAEGTGGILNLITERTQKLEGYSANFSLSAGKGHINGSAYGRTKLRNVTASASVYGNKSLWIAKSEGTGTTENFASETERLRTTKSTNDMSYKYVGGNLNMSWEPDTLNLFTISGNFGTSPFYNSAPTTVTMDNAAGERVWGYSRLSDSKASSLWGSASASYQHTFGRIGHHIVASYYFNYSKSDGYQDSHSYDIDRHADIEPWESVKNDGHSNSHTMQVDYSNKINSHHTIEAGGKMSFQPSYSFDRTLRGLTEESLAEVPDLTVDVKQFKNVGALYASYRGSWDKIGVQAGLRYEYTRMGMRYRTGKYDDFTSRLNDLVPNASVSYNLTSASALRLAYNMRIWRPGLHSLNPFRDTSTPGIVTYGNPDLKSEKNNQISLAYSNYEGAIGMRFSGRWSHTANEITDIIFAENNLIHRTNANLGKHDNLSLDVNLDWRITNAMSLGVSGTARWEHFYMQWQDMEQRKAGWNGNFNANWNYQLPCKLRFGAYGGYGSGWMDLQSKSDGWYYYSISASRSFLKDDMLTVSVYGSNFIPAWRNSTYSQISENVSIHSHSRREQWSAGISLSLRLGKLYTDVKRTAASDSGSDTKDVSSGGGGNSGGGM